MEGGTPTNKEQTSLSSFASYLLILRGMSPTTVAQYTRYVELFLASPPAPDPPTRVQNWITEKEQSASSVTCKLAALKAYCRFAHIKPEWTDDIPRPKRHKGKPKPVKNLEDIVRQLREEGQLELAYTIVFYAETGLRLAEGLRVDVGMDVPDHLPILGKGSKEDIIPLTEDARAALAMLGGKIPFERRDFQRRCKALGFTPHQLRHWLGCALADSGADLGEIQSLLRHESPATTRVYSDYKLDRLRAAQARRNGVEAPAVMAAGTKAGEAASQGESSPVRSSPAASTDELLEVFA